MSYWNIIALLVLPRRPNLKTRFTYDRLSTLACIFFVYCILNAKCLNLARELFKINGHKL